MGIDSTSVSGATIVLQGTTRGTLADNNGFYYFVRLIFIQVQANITFFKSSKVKKISLFFGMIFFSTPSLIAFRIKISKKG